MATSVIYNGVTYSVPSFGDVGYAQGPGNLSQYLVALATAVPSGIPFPNNISFTPPFGIVGVSTNSNAAAGNVGEYISATTGGNPLPTTDAYGDLVSIALTAGDWIVGANIGFDSGGATWSDLRFGITPNAGNTNTGLVYGDNFFENAFASSSTTPLTVAAAIAQYRISLASPTTYYLKFRASYSAGAPTAAGRLSATRTR